MFEDTVEVQQGIVRILSGVETVMRSNGVDGEVRDIQGPSNFTSPPFILLHFALTLPLFFVLGLASP